MIVETLELPELKTVTEQLDALFAPWNRSDAPGLTVGVVKDGKLLYRRGFGMASLESSVANTPKTRMRIASVSKHFTCLLALLLAEDGKLDLDAPIRTYVPELTGPGGDPTLRHLMQHRGGSRCYLDLGFLGHGMTPTPIGTGLDMQARQKSRNFAPGEAMIYNNGGYHVLSIAIERAGGAPFEEQLKQRLFEPLGMFDTALILSDYDITPGMATMHVPIPGGGWRRGLFPTYELRGEGAIVSTLDDMLRWTAHLRHRDKFGSQATWAALIDCPTFPDGTVGQYALGLMVQTYRGVRIIHHSGGVIGGSSEMLTFPDLGLDVVILANGMPGIDPVRTAKNVADIVLSEQLGDPAPMVTAGDYQALLGDWWSPETEMLYSLAEEEGLLKLRLCGLPVGVPLEPLTNGRAAASSEDMGEISVALDEAVDTGELTIRFGGRSSIYRKLLKERFDAAAFAQSVIGRYHSDDGNSTATFTGDGERLSVVFSDPYGRFEAVAHPLSEAVAHLEPASPFDVLHSVVTFAFENGQATNFRLNTGRTRNLAFTRSR